MVLTNKKNNHFVSYIVLTRKLELTESGVHLEFSSCFFAMVGNLQPLLNPFPTNLKTAGETEPN